jgi:hypothetical protein
MSKVSKQQKQDKGKKEKEEKFEDFCKSITYGYQEFLKEVSNFRKTFKSFRAEMDQHDDLSLPEDNFELYMQRAQAFHEYCEIDLHTQLIDLNDESVKKKKSTYLKKLDLGPKTFSNLRFTSKIALKSLNL